MAGPEILLILALPAAFIGRGFGLRLAEKHGWSGWRRSTAVSLAMFLPMQLLGAFTFTPISWPGLRALATVLPLLWVLTGLWVAGTMYGMERVGAWLKEEPQTPP
jgi:hypothetical protein